MKKSILFISKSTILSFLIVTICSLTFHGQAMQKTDFNLVILTTEDDLVTVKIKGPTVKMFKKADREMHMNMYNEIKSAYNIMWDQANVPNADLIINKQFAAEYQFFFSNNQDTFADSVIDAKFFAENIAFSSSNLINEADQSINNQFNAEQ
jgi:hypothetical protein